MSPSPEITSWAVDVADWIRFGLEVAAAVTIATGAVAAAIVAGRSLLGARSSDFTAARFQLGRYLALALEFQLAADILETAISPEWQAIGHLAAIGAIRTALNYFLAREMREERRDLSAAGK